MSLLLNLLLSLLLNLLLSMLLGLASNNMSDMSGWAQEKTHDSRAPVVNKIVNKIASATQLTFSMNEREGACDHPVHLIRGVRLTLQFPSSVRVSVPSHDQQLDLFISGRLVVVSAPLKNQDSVSPNTLSTTGLTQTESVTESITENVTVSVTTELKTGETFLCRFTIVEPNQHQQQLTPIELIRVISAKAEKRLELEAIELIKRRLKAFKAFKAFKALRYEHQSSALHHHDEMNSSPSPELDQILSTWRQMIEYDQLQELLGSSTFSISDPQPLRAQEHLIYVTLERAVVSKTQVYLRVSLRNHSQNEFLLKRVFFVPQNDTRPVIIWEQASASSLFDAEPSIKVLPNGQSYLLALTTDVRVLKTSLLIFEGSEERDIKLNLKALDELQVAH